MKAQIRIALIGFMVMTHFISNGQSDQTANAGLEQAKKAIAASNAIYFTSFTKNDSALFLSRYAKDACLMGGNSPKKCGQLEIAKFFREGYNEGLRGGKFTTVAVYGDGKEFVTEEGIGEIFDGKGNLIDKGKFLVLWKKTNEGWKMFRDSFSSDSAQK